jgi:hypothetical protein
MGCASLAEVAALSSSRVLTSPSNVEKRDAPNEWKCRMTLELIHGRYGLGRYRSQQKKTIESLSAASRVSTADRKAMTRKQRRLAEAALVGRESLQATK